MKLIILLIFLVLIVFLVFLYDYLFSVYPIQTFKLILLGFKHTINKYTSVPSKKRKILFLTVEDRDEKYITLHDNSFKEYSESNGYSYIREYKCTPDISTYWCKIYRVKEYLEKNEYDYIVWVDSDTIITDQEKSIDDYISKYGEKDIFIGTEPYNILIKNFVLYNAGIFIIKNSTVGKNFINDCILYLSHKSRCIKKSKEQGLWGGICYEQGVMNIYLKGKYSKYTYVDYKKQIFNNYMGMYSLFTRRNKVNRGLILHLPGQNSEKRYSTFRKYSS
jgi:hypothetical protein